MQRAALAEDRPQQQWRHLGVDRLAGLDVARQGQVALDSDQRPDALARHGLGGVGQLVGDRMARPVHKQPQDAIPAQHHEAAPQLRLKNDDQAEHGGRQQVVEQPAQHGKVETRQQHLGDQKQANEDEAEPANQAGTARASQQPQGEVERHREDANLDRVPRAERFNELGQTFPQRAASCLPSRAPPARSDPIYRVRRRKGAMNRATTNKAPNRRAPGTPARRRASRQRRERGGPGPSGGPGRNTRPPTRP